MNAKRVSVSDCRCVFPTSNSEFAVRLTNKVDPSEASVTGGQQIGCCSLSPASEHLVLQNRFSVLAGSVLIIANLAMADTATSQIKSDADAQTDTWPPDWLEGVWRNELIAMTCDGASSGKKFVYATHYLFVSGYRFSIFDGTRVTASPMMGQTGRGDVLHCLFKMTGNRNAMRAIFTKHAESVEYVSYLPLDGERFKFERRLTRLTNQKRFVDVVKTSFAKHFYCPHSENGKAILENWIRDQESSAVDQ